MPWSKVVSFGDVAGDVVFLPFHGSWCRSCPRILEIGQEAGFLVELSFKMPTHIFHPHLTRWAK